MTIDEAIAKIPTGYRLRLTNYEERHNDGSFMGSGWGAELFAPDGSGRRGIGDRETPVEAILEAIEDLKDI
jgi:hypothetical protein